MNTPIKRHLAAALLAVAAVLSVCASPAQAAGNAIQSVNASRQGTETVVQINLAQPLAAAPNGFVIDQPARIVLDFPGVDSTLERQTVNFEQGNLRSANVVQAQGRTRVVLNLRQSATYKTQIEGNRLLVLLKTCLLYTSPSPRD